MCAGVTTKTFFHAQSGIDQCAGFDSSEAAEQYIFLRKHPVFGTISYNKNIFRKMRQKTL